MVKNYFKIAWRNLVKNKVFSFINMLGLAVGLASFLLIALYVLDELSFDRFYKNADRIYRINANIRFGGTDLNYPLTSDMMGQALKKDYPDVEGYARVYNSNGSKLVRKGELFINEQKVCHADSTFFRIFQLPVISGNLENALNEPNTVVITENTALKYFGTTEAVGKTLETNDMGKTLYKVMAVIQDIPDNSHFNFDFYFSMKNIDYNWGQYLSHNFHTYLLLREGADAKAFEGKFTEYVNRYCLPAAQQYMHLQSMDDFKKSGNKLEYSMIPLTKIHLYSTLQYEFLPGGNIQYVYIFSAIALVILVIACINFMNLTTARSSSRAKEVGIRKVLGTQQSELIMQFLMESTLMVVFSMLIAVGITFLILPLFNNIADKSMTLKNLLTPPILSLLVLLPFVVGLLAGSYPAFYLSSFRPIEVLKGKLKAGGRTTTLRSILVVFQFATSIVLIIGTIVIYRQLHFIQNRNIGFDKNQVLVIHDAYALHGNLNAFKNELLESPGVSSATISGFLPIPSNRSDNIFSANAVLDPQNGFDIQTWAIDYDYFKTLGMHIVQGRNFSKEFGSDSSAVILNETAAKLMGQGNIIGKKIYGRIHSDVLTGFPIIGVVKNFNFESMRQDIGPMCLYLGNSQGNICFKINTEKASGIINEAENKWKAMAPGLPFSYNFLDQSFNDIYRNEQRIEKIILIFSTLAIFIACLGLFGLSTFMAEKRTREIGIRKVLGATVPTLVGLLSKDFIKLVLISFILAAPLAWYFMNKWLQDFAFRVHMSWWIFLFSALLAVGIALATVSFQAIKSAMMNPVKSLRTE